ncbi:hypothetical protein EXIGLDRAFT_318747 [Exidia glandulosa HHB12029]|uniref:C2H2-type domain-containing protein n=1 Tax=Exidia glandulosa HHB12029 TaxID=1314781 RepID=A0A165Q338_EXIGL|nr:hypothetical protein EXIGLDRAFT_318747 [Exidia glandulosa HHB12029]
MSSIPYDHDFFTDNDLPLLGWEEHLGHNEDAFDAGLPPIDNPFALPSFPVPVHTSGAPALATREVLEDAAPEPTAAVEPAPFELAEAPFALDGEFEVGSFADFPRVHPPTPGPPTATATPASVFSVAQPLPNVATPATPAAPSLPTTDADVDPNPFAGHDIVRRDVPSKSQSYTGHSLSVEDAKARAPAAADEDNEWSCPFSNCATRFKDKRSLLRHMSAGSVVFTCRVPCGCGRTFQRKYQRDQHELQHFIANGEDVSVLPPGFPAAPVPPATTSSPSTSHTGPPSSASNSSAGHLLDHATALERTDGMAKRDVTCPLTGCTAAFDTLLALRRHLTSGPRECPTCRKVLTRLDGYEQHVRAAKCKPRGAKRARRDEEDDGAPGPRSSRRRVV